MRRLQIQLFTSENKAFSSLTYTSNLTTKYRQSHHWPVSVRLFSTWSSWPLKHVDPDGMVYLHEKPLEHRFGPGLSQKCAEENNKVLSAGSLGRAVSKVKSPLLLHHLSQRNDSSDNILYCLPQAAPKWMFGMSISAHFVMTLRVCRASFRLKQLWIQITCTKKKKKKNQRCSDSCNCKSHSDAKS